MLVENYINNLSEEILDLNISKIYKYASRDLIKTRLKNQLSFFDKINLNLIKMADIGSGIGIHSNYFYVNNAQVTLFEPDHNMLSQCKQVFPHLNIVNSEFDQNENFHICTMFGVYQFVSNTYVDMIYQHTRLLIIDSATPVLVSYPCIFRKNYDDSISNKTRRFHVFLNPSSTLS
jgi:hypothetical protein